MFRNREWKWILLGDLLLGVFGSLWFFRTGTENGAVFLMIYGAASLLWLGGSLYRYRRIGKLSAYLKRLLSGDYQLNLAQNTEGELSILENDIYKMSVTLLEQAELLKKDKQYLADTLSDISHQLKTPMTSMMVMTDLLSNPELPGEKRVLFTRQLHSQLERLLWLVSSLLKLSRLDAGAIVMKREKVDVAALVERAAEQFAIPFEIKNITFTLETEREGIVYEGDPEWSAEAVSNLLKNAMEHTPEGGFIHASIKEQNVCTEISIADTGEGISPQDMPHIFERFYRGENASKDSVGIGLNMAKYIVELQNGRLEAESRPGEGTRFVIRFFRGII